MTNRNNSLTWCQLAVMLCFGLAATAKAQTPGATPLVAARWQVTNEVSFVQKEAFPQGQMVMNAGKDNGEVYARLKDMSFENGTIEFDVKPLNDEWPTVRFRVRDSGTAEEFYVRPGPDCAVAIDCLQYAPKIRGRMLWDSNYQYQRPAPFRDNEWNHVKLVISGQRMSVYINHSAQPTLAVDQLEGEDGAGSIELQGPGIFANVVIAPGDTGGLSPEPLPDPTASDRGYVRNWQMVEPQPLIGHAEPGINDLPGLHGAWSPLRAERLGLMNLARRVDLITDRTTPRYAWLKANVHSGRDQVKQVSLGYLRMVTVFVNGQPVFSGKNLYNAPSERKSPDGRLGLENGHFELPLKRGDNQIVVALRSNTPEMGDHYGYGFRFHIDDASGLSSDE